MIVVSNMDDFFRTINTIQKMIAPLQPAIEQTRKMVGVLQPAIEQAQQTQQLIAMTENTLGMSNLVSMRNDLSYILKIQAQTEEINKLQNGILANDSLTAITDYVQNLNLNWAKISGMTDIAQRSLQAQNIAMLRLLPNYAQYDLPYGVKTTVRNLGKKAAKKIAETDDILYDTKDRKFYHKEEPEVKIDEKSIKVAVSSIELLADFTLSELIKFETLLYNNKAFASSDPVGKRIFEIIKNWDNFVSFDCEVYYHARSMKDSPFLEHEMLKAPISVSNSHGRYNDIGISCYYFTDQKDGAINEVRKHIGRGNSAIQVATMKPKKTIRMLDLSEINLSKQNNFIDHIRQAVSDSSSVVKKEYLLPNFVASCCKQLDIEGIKYYSSGYNCYVTWKDDYFDFVEYDIVESEKKDA